ncbi:MAG: hypothetical protein ACRD37_05555 [Candidatus Acidiferrales bacterium]
MKPGMRMAGILMCLLMIPAGIRAQEPAKTSSSESITHLRVDLVLTEYNGEKKISSLPYALYVGIGDRTHSVHSAFLRMGVKVPISTGAQITYQNVGTNIDVSATNVGDGQYRLELGVERSAVYSPEDATDAAQGGMHYGGNQPILRDFNSRFELNLRDGESGEGMSAADPFSGHVMKVNVTAHVLN